jgi:hypothetical protein
MPLAFERAHHHRIAAILGALNGPMLMPRALIWKNVRALRKELATS